MKTSDEIRKFVSQEILGLRSAPPVSDNDDLLALGLDSLGILRLAVFLEDRLKVKVPDEALVPQNVRTVSALTSLVQRLQTGTHGS